MLLFFLGKTCFSKQLAVRQDAETPFRKVVIVYTIYQDIYADFRDHFKDRLVLVDEYDEQHLEAPSFEQPMLLIMDDMAWRLSNGKEFLKLMCGLSHHKNVSVMLLTQSMFLTHVPTWTSAMRSAT